MWTMSTESARTRETRHMRVAVVGAGPSGLAAARAFKELGLDVVVYEAAPDIGGVWSNTRRYPGISTQNNKHTYAYSDRRMPDHAAYAPAGADVREYLHGFARDAGLEPLIRLNTRVAAAEPTADGWRFETRGPDGVDVEHVDWLVVANGLCSKPYVPAFIGRDAFEAAGGLVLPPSTIGDAEVLKDRDVVVLGWGKSAGDIAAAAAPIARSVHVIARGIGWKLPRNVGRIPFERIMLSRLGEHLIWGPHRSVGGRVLRRLTSPLRPLVVHRLGAAVVKQLELERRGLVPGVPADRLDHLLSEGLLEAVDDGTVVVHRETRITELRGGDRPRILLDDGTHIETDVLVSATGYDQDLDLFTEATKLQLIDADGDLALVRYALPTAVPRLAFVGWVNSFRALINAEIQSLWIAAVMLGALEVPEHAKRRPYVFRIGHDRAQARNVPLLPENGSFLTVDQWLADLDLRVPAWRRRGELFGPLTPGVYADVLGRLRARLAARSAPQSLRSLQPATDDAGHE